jgi:hypothetical protein
VADYEVVRSITINADVANIHHQINDFHAWMQWSPWEDIDPAMQRTFTGPETGVGAHYTWSGNRKAGSGSMEITAVHDDRIDVELAFLKPFKATNQVSFELTASGDSTMFSWRMRGKQVGLMALFGRFVSMDKLVGKDFEKGLAKLKVAVETGPRLD